MTQFKLILRLLRELKPVLTLFVIGLFLMAFYIIRITDRNEKYEAELKSIKECIQGFDTKIIVKNDQVICQEVDKTMEYILKNELKEQRMRLWKK